MMISQKSGFTIVEMVFALAILTIISAISIANYFSINSKVTTTNLAYDIGMIFRQAQFYGFASKGTFEEHRLVFWGEGSTSYGVFFAEDYDSSTLGNKKFVTFSEGRAPGIPYRCGESVVAERILDCEQDSEYTSTYTLSNRNVISGFCAYSGGSSFCNNFSEGLNDIKYLNIVFRRPFAEATFYTDLGSNYDYVEIFLESNDGNYTKNVSVYKSGRIFVSD